MAFKPANSGKSKSTGNNENSANFPVPKDGQRKARISLIVDLGIQKRDDFEDKVSGEMKPQKPAHQVAVFADLVSDVVDYGGKIGKAQYRLLLNKSFQGVVQGINFQPVPPRDADGNMIDGKAWGLHPANLLTKVAKAVDRLDVIVDEGEFGMDISQLLDLPFMAQVEVKETEGKKKDANGDPIIYKNVNYKGAAPVPMLEDDETGEEAPMPVAPLKQAARCITFDEATVEDIQFIRSNLLSMIKTADNYAGSNIQKAIEAFEAASGGSKEETKSEEKPVAAKPAAKTAAKPKAASKPIPVDDDLDSDLPF